MTNLAKLKIVFLSASVSIMASCGADTQRTAWSHFEKIPGGGWSPDDMVCFEPWPADSAEAAGSSYEMQLVFRYSTRCGLERLPAAVTVEDADRVISADTLVIANTPTDSTTVREKYGVREVTLTLGHDVRLTDGFSVSVSPLLDTGRTAGLLNVGLRLMRN